MRLGEALPVVFFSSAVDFILPVNCRRAAPHAAAQLQVSSSCRRYPTLLERQVVDRRQLTGKMKSTALGKNNFGTALPRRTIVRLTVFSSCGILGSQK